MVDKESVGLYFHLPFCSRKCPYCHFYVVPNKEPLKKTLRDALLIEWQERLPQLQQKTPVSVYFGGGTPSLFPVDYLKELLDLVHEGTATVPGDIEITIEANPEELSAPLLKDFAAIGINRLSMGVQALSDPLLEMLGRHHTSAQAVEAISMATDAGISNISIDLMYDLPTQSLADWETTLKQAAALPITHLSLYNLTLEPHTVFYKHRHRLALQQPSEVASKEMFEMAMALLPQQGLEQYEISAFARGGLRSCHNTGYWTGRPFLGFGPSAFRYWEGHRFRNIANLQRYARSLTEGTLPTDYDECLDSDAKRRELLTIALRLLDGVDLIAFEEKSGPLDKETKEAIATLAEAGMLSCSPTHIALTHQGILLYDSVAVALI